MDKLLESLIAKAKLECEEAHRQLLFAFNGLYMISLGRRGGLMVSVLNPGLDVPGLSPGWGQDTLYSTLTVLLFTQVYKWVPANVLGLTLRWTSIPSRGK